jgi:P4 family phage/plasmid primase-like protien
MSGQNGSQLLQGALWYAHQGFKVMPVHGIDAAGKCTCGQVHTDPKDIGKHPAISQWEVKATTDPTTIEGWWNTNPLFNVAISCQASGLMVIDIDPRSGGFESFETFETKIMDGMIPETVEAVTGSYSTKNGVVRGRHLYFKVDPNEQLKGNLKAEGLPGIDIKHKGYAMAPLSKHFSGVEYKWLEGHEPWAREIAEAPPELLAVLRKKGSASGTGPRNTAGIGTGSSSWGWVDEITWAGEKLDLEKFQNEGIEEGSRAVDIYAMACALANKYGTDPMNRTYVETLMIRFNYEMVRPPLEQDGPGGLLMHVNRALDFVAANPKTALMGPMGKSASEWEKGKRDDPEYNSAKEWAQNSINQSLDRYKAPEISRPEDPDDHDDVRDFGGPLPGSVGYDITAAIFDGGSIYDAASRADLPGDVDALTPEEGGDPSRRSLTDTGNGRRLVDTFGGGIRYTPGLGWFHWNGSYWKMDAENLETRELAKRIAPAVASEVNLYEEDAEKAAVIKWAQQAKTNSKLTATIESATSDPRIGVEVDNWDKYPHLLGALNGVIDLRTGELLKGRPDLLITRRTPVAYLPGIRNARLQEFLAFATGGDKEFEEWLQRAVGYTLTGLRAHDVMFVVYGPGGTGKTTFVEALVKALGSKQYAIPLKSSVISGSEGMDQTSDQYYWAELRGRRMIWVDELREGERMKENAVKQLTGSSEISARSPGEKPFTFESQGKLWITTNHRPIITDDAMWRRIRPIPWMNVPEVSDPGLRDYLFDPEGGLPALLAWAVEGAIKYLASTDIDPLGWCKAVSDAHEIYKKNEDRFGLFLSEELVEDATAETSVASIYFAYKTWCDARTEKPMTKIAFDRKMADRDLDIVGTSSRSVVRGYALGIPGSSSPVPGVDAAQMAFVQQNAQQW